MDCWICGAAADSGEHRIKASDLRLVFGHVSQKDPVYMHTALRRNRPVGGIKSDTLKSPARLCGYCNNTRTQPYDRAWERFSAYLTNVRPRKRAHDRIDLEKVFPGAVAEQMLGVHLFFAKLFGCAIAEHSVPISLKTFSNALMGGVSHPNLYLKVCASLGINKAMAGYSDLRTAMLAGRAVFATWIYFLEAFEIQIIYAEDNELGRAALIHAWHPSSLQRYVRVVALN